MWAEIPRALQAAMGLIPEVLLFSQTRSFPGAGPELALSQCKGSGGGCWHPSCAGTSAPRSSVPGSPALAHWCDNHRTLAHCCLCPPSPACRQHGVCREVVPSPPTAAHPPHLL